MSFSLLKILKGLLISEENTLTPKEIEIVPGGTANTKTTVVSSQTTNITVTLPNSSDTLATETQVETVQTNLDNHINDAEGAHAASAISNTPADGLAATTVQAALNELNQDIIGLSGDFDTHTEATVAHGTTSDVVGKDDSQTLTNKTISGSDNTLSDIASSSTTFDSETALNIGTSNSNTSVNIGTGTGSNTINIGGANSQVNLIGTVVSQDVENLVVKDKLITINDGGPAGSGAVAGIEVEEDGSPTGYIKTSADRDSWELKAPNANGVVSLSPGSTNDVVTLNAAEQTLTNKTIGDAVRFDGQDATPSVPDAGFYKVYVKDSTGKLTILNSAGAETVIGGGEGNADSNLESLKNQFQDTYFNLLTPNIFRLDELTKLHVSSTGAYNEVDKTYDIDSGEFMLSSNMIDTNEYVSTKILTEAEVSVYWKIENVDASATYQISRNGGTDWQTISMERVGNTNMYRGYHIFSNTEVAPIVTYDLRLKITASASSKLEGYGIFYDKELSANVASGSLNIEVFEFSGSLNTYQFTLTKFVPHPDLLKVYDVNTGQVYDYGAFTFSGQTVVFDSGQFYQPGQTIKLRFIQMEGTAFDNSDVNALLMASNHLGSTDTSIDRSIAGRGIFLRRPDGTLREICIDNNDNIVVYSV